MGVSTRERGVLKLVHPGRHVEIHREPITAAEIMRKYPRHCIARPDVFKFPWIVVRPESVLFPGKVFYLIPNHTLYNLLKAKGPQSQQSLRENKYPKHHDHHQCHSNTRQHPFRENQYPKHHDHKQCHSYKKQDSSLKCWGGATARHCKNQQHDSGHRRRLRNRELQGTKDSHDDDCNDSHSDTSYVDAWTEISEKMKKLQLASYQASPLDSSFGSSRSLRTPGYRYPGHNALQSGLSIVRYGDLHMRSSEVHTQLKSCLRKQDTVPRLPNLKVTFGSPIFIPTSPRNPEMIATIKT